MHATLLASVLLTAAAATPRTFDVLPESTLSYRLVHRFHTVTGTSHAVEGKARLLADGTVQVMVRAPLRSFDSGNSNRDEHMLEATGAAQEPYVVFKGVGALPPADAYPAEQQVVLRGELAFKAVRPVEVPVTVRFDAPDRATITAEFPVSLEEHQVERPSLMFVKVDDRIVIEARFALAAER